MEYTVVEQILYSRVIPFVCLFGIVGNCLNLLALTSMVLAHRTPMDRMERSATAGLLALAVSDLFFCVAVMPLAFVEQVDGKVVPPPDHLTLGLVYQVYHGAVIGLCITLSTWLTVVMAVSRYLAICRPLHARAIIGMRFAVGTILAAVVVSVVLNAPRFLYDEVTCVELSKLQASVDHGVDEVGRRFYFSYPGYLRQHAWLDHAYHASYLFVGILTPLAVLAYCNFFLIRAIRRSLQLRRQFQQQANDGRRLGYASRAANRKFVTASSAADATTNRPRQSQQQQQQQLPLQRNPVNPPVVVIVVDEASNCTDVVGEQNQKRRHPGNPTNVITLTMTIIVIMNVVMVTPSEISNVFTQMIDKYLKQDDPPSSDDKPTAYSSATADSEPSPISHETAAGGQAYNIAIAIANTLQTLNFACNFVLYCVVNVHFRRILRLLFTCKAWWGAPVPLGTSTRTKADSMTGCASPSIEMNRMHRRSREGTTMTSSFEDVDGSGRYVDYRSPISAKSGSTLLPAAKSTTKYRFASATSTTKPLSTLSSTSND